MVKEIFYNIIDFLHHIWSQITTSINDDYDNGGLINAAKNKFSIALIVIVTISMWFAWSGSPSVAIQMQGNAKDSQLPEETIKSAIYVNAFSTMNKDGDVTIGEMKVNEISNKQMEGVDANVVSYEMKVAKKGEGKRTLSGIVALAKKGGAWAVFNENSRQWSPIN
ncbi:MAG: hypothetical protein HZB23_00230 [Deltaproteobacteria bacterium]|nr:hypothetical protein [Deltaproteobacteria bacterium]